MSTIKKPDMERVKKLAEPKAYRTGRQSQIGPSVLEIDLGVPRTLQNLDEQHKSLKKLKYKTEFLQAIKESKVGVVPESTSAKLKMYIINSHIYRFSPSLDLSTKKSFIIYQQGIIENEKRKERYKNMVKANNNKSKMFTTDSKSQKSAGNTEQKGQAGSEYQV